MTTISSNCAKLLESYDLWNFKSYIYDRENIIVGGMWEMRIVLYEVR